jgi:hypothetical protein
MLMCARISDKQIKGRTTYDNMRINGRSSTSLPPGVSLVSFVNDNFVILYMIHHDASQLVRVHHGGKTVVKLMASSTPLWSHRQHQGIRAAGETFEPRPTIRIPRHAPAIDVHIYAHHQLGCHATKLGGSAIIMAYSASLRRYAWALRFTDGRLNFKHSNHSATSGH